MWKSKIELFHIKLGKTNEYEIISKIDRLFYDHYIDNDYKSIIHHLCNSYL